MSTPAVSVLMPTYNYASYLAEAIESVLAQDFRDFELLVVDDCSSDQTAGVVGPFCSRDARVHFAVNPANFGMVNNWNHCLRRARGQYIKFLFGDDMLWRPEALGKLVGLIERHPSAVLAASGRAILDEKSNVTDVWRPWPEGCQNGRKVIAACLVESANLVGEPSAVLFRKRDAQRGFDPKLRQVVDMEMWFHLLENRDLATTPEPLCAFRRHARQQSAVNDAAGIAWQEHSILLASYAAKPWVPRAVRFYPLFSLRRSCAKHPGVANPEMLEWDRRLTSQVGKGRYLCYWVRFKLTHPFHNLKRWFRKRFGRKDPELLASRKKARPGITHW